MLNVGESGKRKGDAKKEDEEGRVEEGVDGQ